MDGAEIADLIHKPMIHKGKTLINKLFLGQEIDLKLSSQFNNFH